MLLEESQTPSQLTVAIRTLLAAGYTVEGNERHPTHSEIKCTRALQFFADVHFLIALTENEDFDEGNEKAIREAAASLGRVPIFVGNCGSNKQVGWRDFLETLGGAVPSWRALGEPFSRDLLLAAANKLPAGIKGEAWAVFEDLVADGLEFCLGRRVRRLGGKFRGQRVSDMLARLPDGALIIVDAKAASTGFDATWPKLRPLVEYVKGQQYRQRGHNDVYGATIVSSSFKQPDTVLGATAREFAGETSATLSFITAAVLADAVALFSKQVNIRNALRWRQIFAGGVVTIDSIRRELTQASDQRVATGDCS